MQDIEVVKHLSGRVIAGDFFLDHRYEHLLLVDALSGALELLW